MLTPEVVARARAETPGCADVLHFNNAGAGLMPAPVAEAIKAHIDLESRAGGYEAEARELGRVKGTYDALARLLHCDRGEIALMDSATRAWDAAFYAVPLAAGDHIVTARSEYISNYLAFLQVTQRTGAVIDVVPDDGAGQMDLDAFRKALTGRVKLVALTHVPTSGGLVNPVAEAGRLVKESGSGALFLLDACQSAGQLPLDVDAIGCDMLSATGRKWLRGPRGTGFLYVRHGALERLVPHVVDMLGAEWTARDRYTWRADARRFEQWEKSYAVILGMAAAVEYALGWGVEATWERLRGLAARLRERLAAVPGVHVVDLGAVKGGIVTFTVEGRDALDVKAALLARRINVSVARGDQARLDLEPRGVARAVRASPHYYNTEDEVDRFVEEVRGAHRG